MNLKHVDSEKILFLDIETVRGLESFDELDERGKGLWEKKAEHSFSDTDPSVSWENAGLYAEFGKIVCISVGLLHTDQSGRKLRIKAFYGHDEKEVLQGFGDLLNSYYNRKDQFLCAHNGKGFDFPFLCKRFLINGLEIPEILDVTGKKPWEVSLIDTMEIWKFGNWKGAVSLDSLAWIFGIPSPKGDIDGGQVGDVFWKDQDLARIVTYCNKDVEALVQVFLKLKREELISSDKITIQDVL